MRIPPGLVDEIRARLPVSQVVSRRVKLKRAGREMVGLSPFKAERTPSFTVNDRKGFYHCFASGEHGDIFTFVMKMEGLSFMEAVERLAAEAGVALPAPSEQDVAREDHMARVRAALEEACQYFEAMLASPAGQEARAYLERRGVPHEQVRGFRLGFAPAARSALKEYLGQRGFRVEEMADAGLLIHGEDIPVPYDRFRGRLIFPIRDLKNRVIAFGGRALAPEQQPKYLNSPDTPLFHKGQVLYNLGAARAAGFDRKQILVAEGYMDVIALQRAGYPNAVAPLGTALTPEQLKLIWRIVPEPTLCFDGDAAGRKAAFRCIDTALPHLQPGHSLRFVFLPEGQDPDDMVRAGASDALRARIAQAEPLIDVLWRRERHANPADTPEQRAALDERLRALTAAIPHAAVRYHYSSALRERLRDAFPFAGRRSAPGRAGGAASGGGNAARNGRMSAFERGGDSISIAAMQAAQDTSPREALILTALIDHPWLLDRFAEDVSNLPFENPANARLCEALLAKHSETVALDKLQLETHLLEAGLNATLQTLRQAVSHRSDPQFRPGTPEQDVLDAWIHVVMLHRNVVSLRREIEDAERAYLDEQSLENFERLRLLKEQAAHISQG
jgi:DNA primase